ncbi:MAG: hybrid-cluster NAD(P)-dependent oxidoreductase [Methylococcaceae bacterium]|nr:hybrid-cluster NAD(P)-dependent oxidoreductase [Methylococcaceae bacterium]
MNNNHNKKSTQPRIERLFQQSGEEFKSSRPKQSFSQRYFQRFELSRPNPFRTLFLEDVHENGNQEPNKTDSVSTDVISIFSRASSAMVANDLASKALTLREFTVLNSYCETLDTKTFRLRSSNGEEFDYLPGQYVSLSVTIAGQEYKRSYSLASSPSRSGIIDITVKRASNGGLVSNWLNDHLKIGDTVNLKGPYGSFSCVKQNPPKILFIAAGSGIVPVMSMLRWLTDTETNVDIVLLLSFRTQYDIIYHDELSLIAARHPNVKLFITLTKEQTEVTPQQKNLGRINQSTIAHLVPDLTERLVYLCGPDTFMEACKAYLSRLNLPKEHVFFESFTLTKPDFSSQVPRAPNSTKKTGRYQVKFAKSNQSIIADGTTTVLELAEKAGIKIEHECLSGNCGECMVKCLQGHVEMSDQAEIDDIDSKKGWLYSCCAYPVSNVVLDI